MPAATCAGPRAALSGKALALFPLPNDGVDLARRVHRQQHESRAPDGAAAPRARHGRRGARATIKALTAGDADKTEYFVDRVAQGVGAIAAAFYPKPAVVRPSDFESSEDAKLVGVRRSSASRRTRRSDCGRCALHAPELRRGLRAGMPCHAPRARRDGARERAAHDPVLPARRGGERVLAEMARHGLRCGEGGLEMLVMCAVRNNVVRIDAFCRIFDGISIGRTTWRR